MTARISSPSLGAASYQPKGTWTGAVSHRWQYSDRHFVGDEEQTQRQAEGSQVINDIHLIDLSVSYALSKRFTATLSVPFQFAMRSQAVRDNRIRNQFGNGTVIDRYETQADGLSDVKVLATAWLLDPDHNKKQNVSVGLGVLFPTGEKDAKDVFKVFATNSAGLYQPRAETRNVDNSIQPGAGAWGIIFDIYGFMEVFENFNVFAAGTYIATPEEAKKGWFASFSAPVALYRNRERNFAGQDGDAAFADFMTLATVGRSF